MTLLSNKTPLKPLRWITLLSSNLTELCSHYGWIPPHILWCFPWKKKNIVIDPQIALNSQLLFSRLSVSWGRCSYYLLLQVLVSY